MFRLLIFTLLSLLTITACQKKVEYKRIGNTLLIYSSYEEYYLTLFHKGQVICSEYGIFPCQILFFEKHGFKLGSAGKQRPPLPKTFPLTASELESLHVFVRVTGTGPNDSTILRHKCFFKREDDADYFDNWCIEPKIVNDLLQSSPK